MQESLCLLLVRFRRATKQWMDDMDIYTPAIAFQAIFVKSRLNDSLVNRPRNDVWPTKEARHIVDKLGWPWSGREGLKGARHASLAESCRPNPDLQELYGSLGACTHPNYPFGRGRKKVSGCK